MRRTTRSRRTILPMLLANGCVAMVTSSGALVVLLIAPLGLAAVLGCTLVVAVLSFIAGVAADVLLWRWLIPSEQTRANARRHWPASLESGQAGTPHGSRVLPRQDSRDR